jgi:atypical dual specificity phosphatase
MDISWIEPGVLAASPLPSSAADVESLYEQGIRAIITLTERPLTGQRGVTPELLNQLEITPLHIAINDMGAPNEAQAEAAAAFIDQMKAEGKPVLVHCKVGQGRTGTILHAYYLSKGWSLPDVKNHVSLHRPICDFGQLSEPQRAFLEAYAAGRTVFI